MNKKKTIIAAIVLLLVAAIGGAIAYFTDTESETNTFTIGNVDITLTEPNWDTTDADHDNVPDAAENIAPGVSVAKDPTITNVSATAPAYVYAKVEIPCSTAVTTPEAVPAKEIFTLNSIGSGWTLMNDGACTNGVATKVYNYGTSSAMTSLAAGSATPAVFSSVSLNSNITGTEQGLSGNKNVVVTGYGIQTNGLGNDVTPATVWSKFSN